MIFFQRYQISGEAMAVVRHLHPSFLSSLFLFPSSSTVIIMSCLTPSSPMSSSNSLRCFVFHAHGVARLNFSDEGFLICLVCTKKIEDLDCAAFVVTGLGRRCSNPKLQRFNRTYADIKLRAINFSRPMILAKKLEEKMKKMKKWVSVKLALYASINLLLALGV